MYLLVNRRQFLSENPQGLQAQDVIRHCRKLRTTDILLLHQEKIKVQFIRIVSWRRLSTLPYPHVFPAVPTIEAAQAESLNQRIEEFWVPVVVRSCLNSVYHHMLQHGANLVSPHRVILIGNVQRLKLLSTTDDAALVNKKNRKQTTEKETCLGTDQWIFRKAHRMICV